MKKELLDIRNDVINAFLNKDDVNNILERYCLKWCDFYNLIAPCLKTDSAQISPDEIDYIIKLYNQGVSTTKIGVKLGIYHKTVSIILKDHNIIIDQSKSLRKYTLDETYFDTIDSPNKAYVLGLLYADGYNNETKGEIRLSLNEYDKDILQRISKCIRYSKPLTFIKCDDKVASNGFISKNMYTLDIYNRHMSDSLAKYGVVQNKSLTLTFPSFLEESLYSHFLRGYFDGDGSYCHRYADKYGWRDIVTFTSTNDFCKKAKEIINQYSLAYGGGIYDASCHNGITKVLSFSGRTQVKNLLDWLYQDAFLYIDRKYQLYHNSFYQNYSQLA